MTNEQKKRLEQLRSEGLGYKRIAAELGLSLNTVQSYCRRHPVVMRVPECSYENKCLFCGEYLHHKPGAKKRKFCSDRCRITWWNAHPETGTKRKVRNVSCAFCGVPFLVVGERMRMYCSRICSARARAKLAHGEGTDG
jgi:endogenous inhibitor of DNA gyrase (YacG/DUF329 family)